MLRGTFFPPEFVLIGLLKREYILPVSGPAVVDALGGNLLYAAAGLRLFGGHAGMIARISNDYPQDWLEKIQNMGVDTEGVIRVFENFDMRYFASYPDEKTVKLSNPIKHFAERNISIPQELIGYENYETKVCLKNEYQPASIHTKDLPSNYLNVKAAHLCPVDFLTHKLLPPVLRSGTIQTISMRASQGYMDPLFWEEIPSLLSDISVFMSCENEVLNLFQGRSINLWEIAAHLADYGPEYIIIKGNDNSQYLYDRISSKRKIIPAYPATVLDPTGADDVFAGAFLTCYLQTYDPEYAILAGNAAASIAVEGCGPFFVLDSLPGLKEARLNYLRGKVIVN